MITDSFRFVVDHPHFLHFEIIARRAEVELSKTDKIQRETEFLVSKLQQTKAAAEKKLESMQIILSIYKTEKTTMQEKFSTIDQVMEMIQGT